MSSGKMYRFKKFINLFRQDDEKWNKTRSFNSPLAARFAKLKVARKSYDEILHLLKSGNMMKYFIMASIERSLNQDFLQPGHDPVLDRGGYISGREQIIKSRFLRKLLVILERKGQQHNFLNSSRLLCFAYK